MVRKCILIVNIHTLLIEGVESLLHSNEKDGFEVVTTLADNFADLIREIELVKPSAIVVDEVASFMNPAELITSLLNTRCVRLIVLNSQTSKMDIYDKSEFEVSHPPFI
jgi:DNA-binding NarL/FixJ family response regulator